MKSLIDARKKVLALGGQSRAPDSRNMTMAHGDSAARSRTYWVFIGLFILLSLFFSFVPIRNTLNNRLKDYDHWYSVGEIVLRGGDIYQKGADGLFQFMYPPTAAVLLAPVSALGRYPLIVVLDFINTAAWVGSVLMGIYLITGRALRQHPLLYLVPTVCTAPYVWDIYLLGQVNLLLLALMLGAFICLRHKREWGAGALIALAVGIKAFPLLSIAYLVYRRHWNATLSTIVFLVAFLVVLPTPFRGFQRNLQDLKTWSQGMALHYDEHSIAQRPARAYTWKNQSLLAVANRLLRPVAALDKRNKSPYVNFANLSFNRINLIVVIVGLGLCLFYVTSMPGYAQRTGESDSIEFAMLLLMILMFSPLSFTYFYVWLLYPLMVALHIVLSTSWPSRERTLRSAWFAAALVLLSLNLPWFNRAQALGAQLWMCLMLLFGLGWRLRQLKPAPDSIVGREARGVPRLLGSE